MGTCRVGPHLSGSADARSFRPAHVSGLWSQEYPCRRNRSWGAITRLRVSAPTTRNDELVDGPRTGAGPKNYKVIGKVTKLTGLG